MKRYLAFAGDNHDADGGWADYRGDFDTEAEAVATCEAIWIDGSGSWGQVVDTQYGMAKVAQARSNGNADGGGTWKWEPFKEQTFKPGGIKERWG